MPSKLKILVIDIGGTNVKVLATGQKERRRFPSGPKMTPRRMVAGVKKLVADWDYDVVAIGYPGRVDRNQPVAEPHNLASGWTRFDFRAAFSRGPSESPMTPHYKRWAATAEASCFSWAWAPGSDRPWSWKA
jgi:predicted NBD/HSP70 family sugar kinase